MLVKPYRMLLSSIVVFILFRTGYINSIVMPPGRFARFHICMYGYIHFQIQAKRSVSLST